MSTGTVTRPSMPLAMARRIKDGHLGAAVVRPPADAGFMAQFRWWLAQFTVITLKGSVLVNAALGIGKLVLGIIALSPFVVVNGVYSLAMGTGRFLCLDTDDESTDMAGQYRRYRLIGAIILGASLLYAAYATRLFLAGTTTVYSKQLAIGIATVVFVELGVSIQQSVARRHDPSPLVHAAKLTSLASALVSLALVQVAVRQLGERDTYGTTTSPTADGWGGLFLGGLAALVGLAMIIHATSRLRHVRATQTHQQTTAINILTIPAQEGTTMKSAIYRGQHQVEITDRPTPECADADILLKNIYSSICGTDVAVYQHGPGTGHKVAVGGEFGHETISRVVALGRKVTGINLGERVYPYPLLATGDPSRAGTIGAFSQYIRVPHPQIGREVFSVPDTIPDRVACLIEPFTIGCRAARRSHPQPGETALVFGAGTIGLAAAIALQHFGCGQIMVADLSDFRLAKAAHLGFSTINPGRDNLIDVTRAAFGKAHSATGPTADIDIVIDATGSPDILDTYIGLGKIDSRLVIVGVANAKPPLDVLALTYGQLAVIGSGGYMPEDVRDVLTIMASSRWDIESLITHEFTLDELPHALNIAADPDSALNVVIRI